LENFHSLNFAVYSSSKLLLKTCYRHFGELNFTRQANAAKVRNGSFLQVPMPAEIANHITANVPRLCDERNSLTQCFRLNECNKLEWWFKVAEYPLIAKPLLAVSKVTPVIGFRKFSWNKSLWTFLFHCKRSDYDFSNSVFLSRTMYFGFSKDATSVF